MHINNRFDATANHLPSSLSAIRKGTHFFVPFVGLVMLCLSARVRADEQVPFKGDFVPVVVSTTQIEETLVLLEFHVDIRATQLGKAQGQAFAILDMTTFAYVGEGTWESANGDSLFLTFTGQFLPTETPGLFDNLETSEVAGGTGRFKGATGRFVAGGQFDSFTLSSPAPAPFTGTISSPGSLKP